MIENIEIKNFRCFEHTKIQDLGLVNLFTGQNNSGKTALLEAIYLLTQPTSKSIVNILKMRQELPEVMSAMPSIAWNNFFFNHKKETPIEFLAKKENNNSLYVKLIHDETASELINYIQKNKDKEDENTINYAERLKISENYKATINISAFENDVLKNNSYFLASNETVTGRGFIFNFYPVNFIPSNYKDIKNISILTEEAGKAKLDNKSHLLLKAFQVIDTRIENFDTIPIGGKAILYLKRENEIKLPLSMFGDAMYRIATFALQVFNNKNSILLIDEIENGIYYKNQQHLWKMLFDLAKEFNVQIFATTHSAEMVKSFYNEAINHPESNKMRYFKLEKNIKTNKIIANKIPISILNEVIINDLPYRGENI
jgi:AAA15 family ATPase/GTPase